MRSSRSTRPTARSGRWRRIRRSTPTGSSRTASRSSSGSSRASRVTAARRRISRCSTARSPVATRRPRRSSRSWPSPRSRSGASHRPDAALHAEGDLLPQGVPQLGHRRSTAPINLTERARALVRHLLLQARRPDLPRGRQAGPPARRTGRRSSGSASRRASTSSARIRACCRPRRGRAKFYKDNFSDCGHAELRLQLAVRLELERGRRAQPLDRAGQPQRHAAAARGRVLRDRQRRHGRDAARRRGGPGAGRADAHPAEPGEGAHQHRRVVAELRAHRACCEPRTAERHGDQRCSGSSPSPCRARRAPPSARTTGLRALRSFAPVPDPKLVTVVVIERGGHGGVAGALDGAQLLLQGVQDAEPTCEHHRGQVDVMSSILIGRAMSARELRRTRRVGARAHSPPRLADAGRAGRRGRARPRRNRHRRRRPLLRGQAGDLPGARRARAVRAVLHRRGALPGASSGRSTSGRSRSSRPSSRSASRRADRAAGSSSRSSSSSLPSSAS